METANVLSWFRDDELGVCPGCGEKAEITIDGQRPQALCLVCGSIRDAERALS
jgi:hypothetical protein